MYTYHKFSKALSALEYFSSTFYRSAGLLPPRSITSYGDNAVGINDLEEFVLYFETEELKSGRGICLGSLARLSLELRRGVVLLLLLLFVVLTGLLAGYCLVPLGVGIGFLGVLFGGMPGAILLSLLLKLLFECE